MEIKNISNLWTQQSLVEDKPKEKIVQTSLKSAEQESDIYDLDVQISGESALPMNEATGGSSRQRVCSQCACDTAGCQGTATCFTLIGQCRA